MNSPLHPPLLKLVGQFQGRETVYTPQHPGGIEAVTFADHYVALGGKFVFGTHIQHRTGSMEPFLNFLIYGLDAASSAAEPIYTLHQFDSTGRAPEAPFRGPAEGATLTFSSSGPMGRVSFQYSFEGENAYLLLGQRTAPDGGVHTLVEGRFERMFALG